jgi:hypothetical protein
MRTTAERGNAKIEFLTNSTTLESVFADAARTNVVITHAGPNTMQFGWEYEEDTAAGTWSAGTREYTTDDVAKLTLKSKALVMLGCECAGKPKAGGPNMADTLSGAFGGNPVWAPETSIVPRINWAVSGGTSEVRDRIEEELLREWGDIILKYDFQEGVNIGSQSKFIQMAKDDFLAMLKKKLDDNSKNGVTDIYGDAYVPKYSSSFAPHRVTRK